MTLEQLVPTLELCQQLRDKGFPQGTMFVWTSRCGEPPEILSKGYAEDEWENGGGFMTLCAAPTAEEILKELPWTLQPWPPTIESAFLRVVKEPDGFRVAWYAWDNKREAPCDGKDKHYEKESEAAAHAYLWWKKEVAG